MVNCFLSAIDWYIFGKTECPAKQKPKTPIANGMPLKFTTWPVWWNPTVVPTENTQIRINSVAAIPPTADHKWSSNEDTVSSCRNQKQKEFVLECKNLIGTRLCEDPLTKPLGE